jgi:hypothetical protein
MAEGQIETADGLWQSGVESLQPLVCLVFSMNLPPVKADTYRSWPGT